MAASGLKSKLRHEARKRGAKLQLSIRCSHGLSRHPDENQPRIAAIRQANPADIRDAKRKIAIGTDVLCAGLLSVRKSGLDQELCHEPERAGIECALCADGLHERQQRMGLTRARGLLLPQSDALGNDGASVRMPSRPTRLEA